MVVGGGEPAVDSAYALSLDPDVPVPSCLQTICDFPHRAHALVGAVFEDNLPTFCGGSTYWDSNTVHQECYKYNYTTNLWGDGTSGSVQSGSKHFAASHTGLYVRNIIKECFSTRLIPNRLFIPSTLGSCVLSWEERAKSLE